MSYINVSNFRYGLDTRRDLLTSLPGTLRTLNNGHVTQGGGIEPRKAFVRTALPAGCLGLETTSVGLITFGSGADPGGWPIGGVVAYQRLQHPAVLAGAAYNAAFHLMTQVVASTVFNGHAFVAAKFADGRTFLYYNGTLVAQSANGIVLPGFASQGLITSYIAQQIATGFTNQNGWKGDYGYTTGEYVNPSGNEAYLKAQSPDTVTYGVVYNNTTAVGVIANMDHGSVAADPGLASAATFSLVGGLGITYAVSAPWTTGSTLRIALVDPLVPVPWAVSNASTATDIINAINARTAITGYSAVSGGATVVKVLAPIPTSTFPTAYNQGTLVVVALGDGSANGNHAFANGTYAVVAWGERDYFIVDQTWQVGDTFQLTIVPNTGDSFVIGYGNIAGQPLNALFVDNERVYIAHTDEFHFSALLDPTGWEDYNTGAGFIPYNSQYGVADQVYGFSDYQGRLGVFGRRSIQIWATNADPAQFALSQTLNNIGTDVPLSIQSIGELETLFLSDTGIRSLRVRDSSLNAYVTDLGSPIDLLVQAVLLSINASTRQAACAIVEPTQNRYWLFLNDTIYVLSYFPSNKITAWSTYSPTYSAAGVQTAFTPQKFVVYNNQVFARDANAIYAFGGADNNTYDGCTLTVQTGFMAGTGRNEKPATNKVAKGVDVAMQGAWTLSAGMDWVSGTLEDVYVAGQSSFDGGRIPFESAGTHFSLKAVAAAASGVLLSSLIFHFEEAEETA